MMQKKMLALAVIAASSLLAACNLKGHSATASSLGTDDQKFSYALGVQLGQRLQQIKAHVDVQDFEAGFEDSFNGRTPVLDDAARQAIGQKMSQQISQEQMAQRTKEGAANKAAGDAFLASNKTKPGVKVTASGLQYEVEHEGSGAHPGPNDIVTVNYRGTLLDGTEFDSSYTRKEPASFALNRVIAGWGEGIQLMTPGAKYKFYIPSNLAYDLRGSGTKIGPNATLIFEVELISSRTAPPMPAFGPGNHGGPMMMGPHPMMQGGAPMPMQMQVQPQAQATLPQKH